MVVVDTAAEDTVAADTAAADTPPRGTTPAAVATAAVEAVEVTTAGMVVTVAPAAIKAEEVATVAADTGLATATDHTEGDTVAHPEATVVVDTASPTQPASAMGADDMAVVDMAAVAMAVVDTAVVDTAVVDTVDADMEAEVMEAVDTEGAATARVLTELRGRTGAGATAAAIVAVTAEATEGLAATESPTINGEKTLLQAHHEREKLCLYKAKAPQESCMLFFIRRFCNKPYQYISESHYISTFCCDAA